MHGRAFAAHAHWLLGHDDEAVASAAEAVTLARSATPYNLAVALAYAAVTHQFRRDRAAVSKLVEELCDLCDRYDFAYYREWALILEGWARFDARGLEMARRGVDNLVAQNSFARMPYWLSIVAEVAHAVGRPETARARLDAALVAGNTRNDLFWLPEVMRMRAAYDDDQAAVDRLESAAKMAAAHGSVALADRCAADLAEHGRRHQRSAVRSGR